MPSWGGPHNQGEHVCDNLLYVSKATSKSRHDEIDTTLLLLTQAILRHVCIPPV